MSSQCFPLGKLVETGAVDEAIEAHVGAFQEGSTGQSHPGSVDSPVMPDTLQAETNRTAFRSFWTARFPAA